MKTVEVTFRVQIPVEATDDEIREWIRYELKQTSILKNNPLLRFDLEAQDHIRIWECQ